MNLKLLVAALLLSTSTQAAESLKAVDIYSQESLLTMLRNNTHLQQVRRDECQLLQDIEARASVLKVPAYQMLWADMQLYGVCTPKNVEQGWEFLQMAAGQGLSDAIEQIGRYHMEGRFVVTDQAYGLRMLHIAASMGHQRALLSVADYYGQGYGSAWDYSDVYQWLHHAVFSDEPQRRQAQALMSKLAQQLPPSVRKQTRRSVLRR
ncbi:tetratricopeptide repeat protein [Ferrimonas lipolytica]|uniref:Sel1 repeat family protein n=1 Tax=Ferrimonas lipolytica TaxID=2724191 RepID=A0A6H1UKA4_9GAMM|nr:sel1 repeat family protein [Ferrimonas lipolytica]QIZ78656.1 sel1 repeat family protein [Ferrimonas lipolytica]